MMLLWHKLRWFVSGANFTNRSMLMLYLPFRDPWLNSKSLISCQYVSGKRFVRDKRSLYRTERLGIPSIKLFTLHCTLSIADVMVQDWPDQASLA